MLLCSCAAFPYLWKGVIALKGFMKLVKVSLGIAKDKVVEVYHQADKACEEQASKMSMPKVDEDQGKGDA